MSSTLENKILNLQERLRAEKESRDRDRQTNDIVPGTALQPSSSAPTSSPVARRPRQLGDMGTPTRPKRQLDLPVLQMVPPKAQNGEFESKLQEIMKQNGILNINGQKYQTDMKDLEHLGELGNGTCGHVVKMRHKPSGVVIAVKQMRRSGNAEENKRIIMDLDVVLKSHDCPYIVQCLGCFITESDVWICMELMATCLDKLLKKCRQAIPEDFLGKVTVATVKALSYLKEKHGVIHRDVKPSNILLDEMGGVKLCDFGISGRLVDSKAKTRSAGCAAYMAPERIDPPDPTKPDYDIRADVWSLGITLVELATGVFPYRDCKTDFEVLSRVVQDDPPSLPLEAIFSKEFRSFVTCCLTKNYKHRPKYHKLMEHPFIRNYETQQEDGNTNSSSLPTSGCQWFGRVMRQLEPSFRLSGGQQQHQHQHQHQHQQQQKQQPQPQQQQQQQKKKKQQQQQHHQQQQQHHQQQREQQQQEQQQQQQQQEQQEQQQQQPQQQQHHQQQPHPPRATGHVSLKQTAHLRAHSEVPAFMKSNATKDHHNTPTTFLAFHQRSSSENSANYLPYSPYAIKRKDVIPRPFSPPATKDPLEPEPAPSLQTRPFSPWRQHVEQTSREYAAKRCSANGQAYADGRSYSPYKHETTNSVDPSARPYSPYQGCLEEQRDSSADRWQNVSRSLSPFARDYSPWRRENVDPPGVVQPVNETGRYSPFVQQRLGQLPPAPQTHQPSRDIYGSPMVSRKRFPSEPPPQGSHGSTSPQLLISRFAHQLKQDPPATAAQSQSSGGVKESAKKRFASYVRLRLGGERAPSPEPPPRMNRGESPLAVRRNMVDQPSPSFPRRYVSPSPPQPPPRRLSESNSVPGSPQYVRARLRYTPEPQRRPPPP